MAADDIARLLRALARRELAEIQGLRGGHELDPQHAIGVIQDLPSLDGRVHSHRDKVLLVGRGRDGLDAGGRAQDALFHDQVVHGVLRKHQPGVKAGLVRQEIRQPLREGGVRQAVKAALREHRDHGDGRTGHIHGQGHGRTLEVRPGQREIQLGHEDRVVPHPVQLDLHLRAGVSDRIPRRPDDLWRGAHGVGILHLGLHFASGQVRAFDQSRDVLRRGDRPLEAPQLVQLRVIGLHVAEQRLDGHGCRDLGLLQPALHVKDVQRRHGREQVGAVDGRQPVARLQAGDLDPCPPHGLRARQALALEEGLALSHQQQRHLGHGGQVSARAHRSLLADDGCQPPVQHLDQRQRDLGPAARVPVGMDVDAPGHGRAHVFDGRRVADPRGVVVDQILLEFLHLVVGEDLF